MWETCIDVYDAYRDERFNLRALLFSTIRYSIKGNLACPVCEDNTHSTRMPHYKKNVYLGHHRFLHPDHQYRAFDENNEESRAPLSLTGD
ncbi:hypothetical protein Lal_00017410 [Lupinus albus]|nr:hypothetical protein Lal_00017410 [Lupinus albus]